jgi:hypothetical protein
MVVLADSGGVPQRHHDQTLISDVVLESEYLGS